VSGLDPRPPLCFVCPFDLDRPSGTPTRARATVEALEGHHEPHILATTDGCGAEALPGVWARDGNLSPTRFIWAAFRRLVELRPRVIHCFTPLALAPAIAARAFLRGPRLVVEVHGAAEFELIHARPHVRAFFTFLDRRLIKRADAVLAMSTPGRTYLKTACGVTAPIVVSWGPVDVERRPFAAPPLDRIRRFGYFGNPHFWQGLDDLMEAARLCSDAPLHVVVGGVERAELSREPPGSISVKGKMERCAMLDAMAECDVLVSPRRGGPVADCQYPFKLSAYLAAGRAVIGTDVSDQATIIRTARCGLVVPPHAPQALADAILELCRLPSEALRERGVRSRAFAERRLGFDKLREQLEVVYGFQLG
jgi:glycosyltransferase involved in cell wall biosynthesis